MKTCKSCNIKSKEVNGYGYCPKCNNDEGILRGIKNQEWGKDGCKEES